MFLKEYGVFNLLPGIDLLLSKELSNEIKKQLEKEILKKVERELFLEHGMSIKLSMENFQVFHNVLKKNSKIDLITFEKNCLNKIIEVSPSKNNYLLKITNQNLAEKLFDFFGDAQSRKILQCIMGEGHTVAEILKKSKVLKSPAYRKLENFLIYGLIFESGKILDDKKRISQYECIFNEIHAEINKDSLFFEGEVNGRNFRKSSILKTGLL